MIFDSSFHRGDSDSELIQGYLHMGRRRRTVLGISTSFTKTWSLEVSEPNNIAGENIDRSLSIILLATSFSIQISYFFLSCLINIIIPFGPLLVPIMTSPVGVSGIICSVTLRRRRSKDFTISRSCLHQWVFE